jgi:hypothetical protein
VGCAGDRRLGLGQKFTSCAERGAVNTGAKSSQLPPKRPRQHRPAQPLQIRYLGLYVTKVSKGSALLATVPVAEQLLAESRRK